MATAFSKWYKSQHAEVLSWTWLSPIRWWDVKLKGSLGCIDHEVVDFKVPGAVRSVGRRSLSWITREQTSASSRISLVECHGIEPWREEQPKSTGWYWRVVFFRFKGNARGNQERKAMDKELLEKLKHVTYRACKEGKAVWEEYTEIVQRPRERVRKAEVQAEIHLAKDIKGKEKRLLLSNQRQTQENIGPFRRDTGYGRPGYIGHGKGI